MESRQDNMKRNIDYSLYLVTDRDLMAAASIEECVEQAVSGGCTLVQLREKTASSREFYETALRVRKITADLGVPLIINDRADIALAVNADGVHVGQDDLTIDAARRIMGKDAIIGASVNNLTEALAALGADYLGVGAMFATGTKTDADIASMDELRRIRAEIKIPVVVIGGINKNNVPLFAGTGIDGIAVVSAIVSQKDARGAARELKELFKSTMGKNEGV
ncbi:MAG: thiamine phosphate synthase [Treponema sp.]|jgi:thiamine-phosphate pyrophosphorylase|nr:thiamine phosphate synthase [Treponema sp.]